MTTFQQLPLVSCVALQAVDAVGEILLSLSYLPTAERLTVVVAKCKNLVWTNSKTTAGQRLSSSRWVVCVFSLQSGFTLILLVVVVRSVCQSLSAARRPEDQQEEDLHQEGRHQPHLQRGHDLLSAVHRPAGRTLCVC